MQCRRELTAPTQYTLPRLAPPHPDMPKKIKQPIAPGSSKSITVHLKSARNPVLDFSLPNAPLSTTSVQDLKDAVRDRVADASDATKKVSLDKIKILYKKKPVTGNKTVAEILADESDMLVGGREVEFGVMIMGGAQAIHVDLDGDTMETATDTAPTAAAATGVEDGGIPKPAVGPHGEEVLRTDGFWDDLQGFLEQRLKDEETAKRLRGMFYSTWTGSQ